MDTAVAYLLFVVVSIAALLALAAYGWRHRKTPVGSRFALLALSAAAWCVLIVAMATAPPAATRLLLGIKYVFIATTSVSAFLTVTTYLGRLATLTRLQQVTLFALPCLCALLTLSDDLQMIRSVAFARSGGLVHIAAIEFGPVYWAFTGYLYALNLWSLGLLFAWSRGQGPLQHGQSAPLSLGLLAPLITNTLLITGIAPRRFDPMPLGLVIAAMAFWWAIFRHRLLDLVPIARHVLADTVRDAILVVDADGRVIDVNRQFATLIDSPPSALIGRRVDHLVAADDGLAGTLRTLAGGAVPSTVGYRDRVFDISVAMVSETVQSSPRIIQLQDVTERQRWQEEQARLIAELRSALAEVRTLSGLLPICAGCKKIRDDSGQWQPVEEYIHGRTNVQFSHGMCPQCMAHWYADVETGPTGPADTAK